MSECIIVKQDAFREIVEKEIKKLFSETAHDMFDFDDMDLEVLDHNGIVMTDWMELQIVIKKKGE